MFENSNKMVAFFNFTQMLTMEVFMFNVFKIITINTKNIKFSLIMVSVYANNTFCVFHHLRCVIKQKLYLFLQLKCENSYGEHFNQVLSLQETRVISTVHLPIPMALIT